MLPDLAISRLWTCLTEPGPSCTWSTSGRVLPWRTGHGFGVVGPLPRQRAVRLLEEQLERIRGGGGGVEGAHLRMGRPAEETTALAGELDAERVVVGSRDTSRGTGAAQRLVTGSVSEEVARNAPCPTLVLRGRKDSWSPQAVVVGDDLSKEAERAGYVAARIRGLLDASGLLARAFPSQAAFGHAAASRASGRIVGESGEVLRRRAILSEDSLGKRPAIRVAGGDAAAVIRTAVGESEKPALVAVGSGGRQPRSRSRGAPRVA
jgi:nucleotide-binding universal stress UspA family protein